MFTQRREGNKANSFPSPDDGGKDDDDDGTRAVAATPAASRKPPPEPPVPATLYYLESYSAGCLVANRIVTRMPFAGLRGRIAPIRYRNRRRRFKVAPPSRASRLVIGVISSRCWSRREEGERINGFFGGKTVAQRKEDGKAKEQEGRKESVGEGRKARSERSNDRARIILPTSSSLPAGP